MTQDIEFGPTVNPFGVGAPLFLDYNSNTGEHATGPTYQVHGPPRRRRRRQNGTPGNTVGGIDHVIVPHWDSAEGDIWDWITIGHPVEGQPDQRYTFSGTVRIEGNGPVLSVDRRKRKGANGARLITNGYDTTELKIILRVWLEEHLADYEVLVAEVNPRRTGKPFALDVYHPALALARIDRVLVYGVGFLKPTGTQGLFESVLSCFEFQEPDPTKNATQRVRVRIQEPNIDAVFHTESDRPGAATSPRATNANP